MDRLLSDQFLFFFSPWCLIAALSCSLGVSLFLLLVQRQLSLDACSPIDPLKLRSGRQGHTLQAAPLGPGCPQFLSLGRCCRGNENRLERVGNRKRKQEEEWRSVNPRPDWGGGSHFVTLVRSNLQAGGSRGTDCADHVDFR